MANDEHVALLKQGVAAWNAWRKENPTIRPELRLAKLSGALADANLSEADLTGQYIATILGAAFTGGANLSGANLKGADLSKADLRGVDLGGADLRWADLRGADLSTKFVETSYFGCAANLSRADLRAAKLDGAKLRGANLCEADLRWAYLREAYLNDVCLEYATLVNTDLTGADLTGCRIHGISAWNLKLEGAKQQNLIITPAGEAEITVDDIEVAQFIYLMLNNRKVRNVIDTITSKAVLILGRFTDERKAVLDALREELRKRDYLPILFDFEKPRSRDTDETITLLARMARFIVADITDAKAVLQELRAIVPDLPSVPVQPVIAATQEAPGMFDFYRNFRSFLKVHPYASQEQLIAELGERVICPAELKLLELRGST